MDVKFQWTQDMSVHNDVIDAQHKELFEKINELLEAIITNDCDTIVDDMVNFFEKYMNGHLTYEEAYLREMNYPHIEEHHKQHEVFTQKYNDLKQELTEKDVDKNKIVFDIENFMGSWLTSHILIEDQKYAKYLQQK